MPGKGTEVLWPSSAPCLCFHLLFLRYILYSKLLPLSSVTVLAVIQHEEGSVFSLLVRRTEGSELAIGVRDAGL